MDILSKRFISSYNKIDRALRQRLSLKPSIPFSDVIRRAGVINSAVKRHEDELYAYARLRNAIVHSVSDDQTIASPHEKTVQSIEALEALILTPPRAIDFAKKPQVLCGNESLLSAVLTMSQNDYSNMPVVSENRILGVVTNKLIVKALSRLLTEKNTAIYDYMQNNSVASVLTKQHNHYILLDVTISADEVLTHFQKNPKLQIAMLMNGESDIRGVITTGDLAALNDAVDS